jgi:hypothetical protein
MANDPTEFKNILLNCFCCSSCGFHIIDENWKKALPACDKKNTKNYNPTAAELKNAGQSFADFMANQDDKPYTYLTIGEFMNRKDEFLGSEYDKYDKYNNFYTMYLTDTQVKKLKQKKLTGSYSVNAYQQQSSQFTEDATYEGGSASNYYNYFYQKYTYSRFSSTSISASASKNRIKLTDESEFNRVITLNNSGPDILTVPGLHYYGILYRRSWSPSWFITNKSFNYIYRAYEDIINGGYTPISFGWGGGYFYWYWFWSRWIQQNPTTESIGKSAAQTMPYMFFVNRNVSNGYRLNPTRFFGYYYYMYYGYYYFGNSRPYITTCSDEVFFNESDDTIENKNSPLCYNINLVIASQQTNSNTNAGGSYYAEGYTLNRNGGYYQNFPTVNTTESDPKNNSTPIILAVLSSSLIIGKKITNQNDKNYQKTECYFLIRNFSSAGGFGSYGNGSIPARALYGTEYRNYYGWWGWYGYGWWGWWGWYYSWEYWNVAPPNFSININAYAQLSLNLFGNYIYLDLNDYTRPEAFAELQFTKIESEYRRINLEVSKKIAQQYRWNFGNVYYAYYFYYYDSIEGYVNFNGSGSSNYTAYISINSDNSSE